jgi:hypothetical protein
MLSLPQCHGEAQVTEHLYCEISMDTTIYRGIFFSSRARLVRGPT